VFLVSTGNGLIIPLLWPPGLDLDEIVDQPMCVLFQPLQFA
jgi:hypothetical protein